MLVCLTVLATGVVGAAEDDGPTPTPPAYFGLIEIDGDSSPKGVTVTAHIDGEKRGSLTTQQAGGFGGSSVFDRKLVVNGTTADVGKPIMFRVNGRPARPDTPIEWTPGEIRRINLVVEDAAMDVPDTTVSNPARSSNSSPLLASAARLSGEAQVEMTADTARITAEALAPSETVAASLPAGLSTETIQATELTVAVTDQVDRMAIEATTTSDSPSEIDPPASVDPVSYLNVNPVSVDPSTIESATIEFELMTTDLVPSNISVYRDANTGWEPLPVVQLDDDRIRARTTQLSSFVIAPSPTRLAVTERTLDTQQVTLNTTVQVLAQVKNRGKMPATSRFALAVDGYIIDDRQVHLRPGETRQVMFTPRFVREGQYNITVGAGPAGVLTVTSDQQPVEANTPSTSLPVGDLRSLLTFLGGLTFLSLGLVLLFRVDR